MNDGFMPGVCVGALVVAVLAGYVFDIVQNTFRADAVAHGKAQWAITNTNSGSSEFQWITNGGSR